MGLRVLQIDPAPGLGAGLRVQASEFGNAQPAAVEQLGQAVVADIEISAIAALPETGQLHRFVDAQRLGQGLGRLGRSHALHRVMGQGALKAQPGIKPAPARQDERDAAPAAAPTVHLGDPAAHIGRGDLLERDLGLGCELLQLEQVLGIQGLGARGQTLLHPHMAQISIDQRLRGLCSAALHAGHGRSV